MSIGWDFSQNNSTATCFEFFPTGFCLDMTCPDNAICTNGQTEGVCSCRPGYVFSDETNTVCQEKVNECTNNTHNCHANAFCTDTDLSFGCVCDDGYDGDGVTCTIVCAAGTEPNDAGNLCVDINECDANPCGENFDCVNGNNAFTCNCDTTIYDLGKLEFHSTLAQRINQESKPDSTSNQIRSGNPIII